MKLFFVFKITQSVHLLFQFITCLTNLQIQIFKVCKNTIITNAVSRVKQLRPLMLMGSGDGASRLYTQLDVKCNQQPACHFGHCHQLLSITDWQMSLFISQWSRNGCHGQIFKVQRLGQSSRGQYCHF